MKAQTILERLRRIRAWTLAFAAVFLCLHGVIEPLHAQAHFATPSHQCAICAADDLDALPVPTVLSLTTGLAFLPIPAVSCDRVPPAPSAPSRRLPGRSPPFLG